jgi:hypothetical protein
LKTDRLERDPIHETDVMWDKVWESCGCGQRGKRPLKTDGLEGYRLGYSETNDGLLNFAVRGASESAVNGRMVPVSQPWCDALVKLSRTAGCLGEHEGYE